MTYKSTKAEKSDLELVLTARESAEGFGKLYQRYFNSIFGYVAARVTNRGDAEDITALTFEKALRSLWTFDEKKASFKTWLYRIATNNISDYYRKTRENTVSIEYAELVTGVNGKGDVEDVQWYQSLLSCMKQLPDRQQSLLTMKFVCGLSNEEIISILGCQRRAYSMRLLRALRALKKVAEKHELFDTIVEGSADA